MRRLLFGTTSLITAFAFAHPPVDLPLQKDGVRCELSVSVSDSASDSASDSDSNSASDSASMLRIGRSYLGTSYVAHTLDQGEEEALVIRTDAVDCLTFVEYTLAQALGSSFADNLQKIRYRDGIIDGYTSRLHYTSEWIENGVRHGFLTDVTANHSAHTTQLVISYMSTHAGQYKKLANSPEEVKQMAEYEQALSGKSVHWLPKSELPETGLPWIMDGDILAITTKVSGLDIAHVGIATYINEKLHLLHASSTRRKVVVSDTPLSQMLNRSRSWTGIRVVRMRHAQE